MSIGNKELILWVYFSLCNITLKPLKFDYTVTKNDGSIK